MTDFSMTSDEVKKLLEAIGRDQWAADMESIDAICYGGDCEKLGANRRHVERIIKAVPKRVLTAYNKSLNKEKADKLRAQADKIERGET